MRVFFTPSASSKTLRARYRLAHGRPDALAKRLSANADENAEHLFVCHFFASSAPREMYYMRQRYDPHSQSANHKKIHAPNNVLCTFCMWSHREQNFSARETYISMDFCVRHNDAGNMPRSSLKKASTENLNRHCLCAVYFCHRAVVLTPIWTSKWEKFSTWYMFSSMIEIRHGKMCAV